MNQQQRKYALERVTNITNEIVSKIRQKYTEPSIRLTFKEKLNALRDGEFEVTNNTYSYPDNISTYLIFTAEKDGNYDKELADSEIFSILKEASVIKDQIMLGEEEEALRLLTAFAKLSY